MNRPVATSRDQLPNSQPPKVVLRNYFLQPYDTSISAARTCYSPRVIGREEVSDKQRDSIGRTTFEGGHHTVYQHAHFEFGLENISRQFVWNFLHSYPFYNSEQSSQRYVRLDEVRAFVPPLKGESLLIYQVALERAWAYYRKLSALLQKDAFAILSDIRYLTAASSEKRKKKVEREAEKKAIETARYVLPIAAFTSMVHTISGITLHRLRRMMYSGDTPYETSLVISQMVERVQQIDPLFFTKVGEEPLELEELPEFKMHRLLPGDEKAIQEFDEAIGNSTSKLVDFSPNAERLVADSVRYVLGIPRSQLSDAEAIDQVLDPAKNRYRLDAMNLTFHSPMMRALHHPSYSFLKKISHTADSQEQRHRMIPGSRPVLSYTDTRSPDFITPGLIQSNAQAREMYQQAMQQAWDAKNRLLENGIPIEFATYLLPNAKAIRFIESGSLLYLMHKWTLRTCLNAQDEIYQASMEELEQVRVIHPQLAKHMGPPCVIRNGLISPRCTEGERFCGIPVWNQFPNVVRKL